MKTTSVEKDQAKVYFKRLDVDKSMRPAIVHPQVVRELANVIGHAW